MIRLITTYDQIPQAEWQQLTDRSPVATWFQSPDGYRFLEGLRDYRPLVVAVTEDDGLKGVCVCQLSRSRHPMVHYLTRRAVINGGPLLAEDISGGALVSLLRTVDEQLRSRVIFTEIRCFHDYSGWAECFVEAGWQYEPHLNFHIACTDAEAMRQALSENRRRQIVRAESLGVRIEPINDERDLRAWYAILRALYRRVHRPLPGIDFFRRLMTEQVILVVRAPGGQIVGGIALVELPGRALYEWYICGLDEQCRAYAPSVMATWAAMNYARENGLPLFDVMGAGKPDVPYGVREFKQKFGGRLVEHGRWIIVANSWLYRLGKAVYALFFRKK